MAPVMKAAVVQKLKLKVKPKIWSAVADGVAIKIARDGASFRPNLDYTEFGELQVYDPLTQQVLVQNIEDKSFWKISVDSLIKKGGVTIETDGDKFRFEQPDGTFSDWIDPTGPEGPQGPAGDTPVYPSTDLAAASPFDPDRDYFIAGGATVPGDATPFEFVKLGSAPVPAKPWHTQNANGTWYKMAPTIWGSDARRFKGKGDGTTNDTQAVQDAINWSLDQLQALQEQVGANPDIYSGTLPALNVANGRYKITEPLKIGGYFRIEGQNAALIQADSGAPIIDGLSTGPFTGVYRFYARGINFVGGSNHITLENDNIDATMFVIDNCEFHLSSDYAIKTAASGGTWHHLSAHISVTNCLFSRVNKVLDNVCDKASINGGWIYVDKDTVTPGTAMFRNRGETGLGRVPPRLHLERVLMVPTMGTYGVDRVDGMRWIDNYGVVTARNCRHGGEDAGMAIVMNLGAPATTDMAAMTAVILESCDLACGPSDDPGSGVVLLSGEVPNLTKITGNYGPVGLPYMVNLGGSVSVPGYFNAWEAATGLKDYEGFTIDPDTNFSKGSDGVVIDYGRIPPGFEKFVKRERMTAVRRTTTQSIAAGGANNFVSFDTVDFDNYGAYSSGNTDRLTPKRGAPRLRLTFSGTVSQATGGSYLTVSIVNSSGAVLERMSLPTGTNPDGVGFSVSAEVPFVLGDYLRFNITHNSSGSITLSAGAKATIRPINYVS